MEDICSKINSYRYGRLENEFRKAEGLLKLNQDMKNDLLKMRKDLLDSNDGGIGIYSLRFATSKGALATGEIAACLKLICEKFNDTLEFIVPEEEGAAFMIKQGLDIAGDVIDQLKSGGELMPVIKTGFKHILFNGKAKQIQRSVMMVWDFADNLKEIVTMQGEQKELIEEVNHQLDHLDRMVQKYENEVNVMSKRLLLLNSIKEKLDRYYNANCGYKYIS